MGELSARHLRGASMADVVFTGSHTRQPLSQAAVELVFDNGDGRLGGRFASYPEISIKRQVGREGYSQYFLNSAQCRRRDVMDVFLGTGLGPRSYTIIEQGTISRLIEARPEELRAFLEEAAGIAKYRERRRETENRIRHARENLERLGDRREEIGRRLVHLKRQATIAERYKVFKEEERVLEAELVAQRWRRYDAELARQQRELGARERALDAAMAGQRRAEAALEHERAAHQAASDTFNQLYRQVVDAGTEIARSEERIRGIRQQRERAEAALGRERADLGRARSEAREEQGQLESTESRLAGASRDSEAAERRTSEARAALRQSEEAMRAWQAEWEAIRERAEAASREARSEQSRLEYARERLAAMRQRAGRLDEERARFAIAPLQRELDETRARLEAEQSSLDALATRRAGAWDAVRSCRARQESLGRALHEKRAAREAARGREAALERLQLEARGDARAGVEAWLGERGIAEGVRLADEVRTSPGWERAVQSGAGDASPGAVRGRCGGARSRAALPRRGPVDALPPRPFRRERRRAPPAPGGAAGSPRASRRPPGLAPARRLGRRARRRGARASAEARPRGERGCPLRRVAGAGLGALRGGSGRRGRARAKGSARGSAPRARRPGGADEEAGARAPRSGGPPRPPGRRAGRGAGAALRRP